MNHFSLSQVLLKVYRPKHLSQNETSPPISCSNQRSLSVKMIAQSGYTLLEVMLAAGLLSVVALTGTYFVVQSQKNSTTISNDSACNTVANAYIEGLSGYGVNLDPAPPQFDSTVVATDPNPANPAEAFVKNWTPLPVLEPRPGGRVRNNSFQLKKSAASALLAIYNTEGSANVCQNYLPYPESNNLLVNNMGRLQIRNGSTSIRINPINMSTGEAMGCPASLGTAPMRDGSFTGPPVGVDSWPTNIGMNVEFLVNYTAENGTNKSCSASKLFAFDSDNTNTTPTNFSNITIHSGPFNSATPFVVGGGEVPLGTLNAPYAGEYYACNNDDITVRLRLDTTDFEPATAVLCRMSVLDDPSAGTLATSSSLSPCDNLSFAAIPGLTVSSYYSPALPMYVYRLENLAPDRTYSIEFLVIDAAGNTQTKRATFSVDISRPIVSSLIETTAPNQLVPYPPVANTLPAGAPQWPNGSPNPTLFQCNDNPTTFAGVIGNSLLQRTSLPLTDNQICNFAVGTPGGTNPAAAFTLPVPHKVDIAGPPFRFNCLINSDTPSSQDGDKDIVLNGEDLCGVGLPAQINYLTLDERPRITSWVRNETTEGFDATVAGGIPDYRLLWCPCTDSAAVGNFCPAGGNANGCDPEVGEVRANLHDICTNNAAVTGGGPNRTRTQNYCPPGSWYTLTTCQSKIVGTQVCNPAGVANCFTPSSVTTTTLGGSTTTTTTIPSSNMVNIRIDNQGSISVTASPSGVDVSSIDGCSASGSPQNCFQLIPAGTQLTLQFNDGACWPWEGYGLTCPSGWAFPSKTCTFTVAAAGTYNIVATANSPAPEPDWSNNGCGGPTTTIPTYTCTRSENQSCSFDFNPNPTAAETPCCNPAYPTCLAGLKCCKYQDIGFCKDGDLDGDCCDPAAFGTPGDPCTDAGGTNCLL